MEATSLSPLTEIDKASAQADEAPICRNRQRPAGADEFVEINEARRPLSPQPKLISTTIPTAPIPTARSISAISRHLSLSPFSCTSLAISPSLPSHAKEEKSKTDQAKELLAKYGGAYLATSISLSLISFSLYYLLVSAGIDVQALLQKVDISTNETVEKVGTFALAYAAHKVASPIRFPPTVALTPIVASWIGKKKKGESDES